MGFSAVPPRLVPQRKGVVKMAKNSKLPGSLKAWRIVSSEPDGSFIVSKKGTDGKKPCSKSMSFFTENPTPPKTEILPKMRLIS